MLTGTIKLIKSIDLSSNSPHRVKLPVNGGTYKRFFFRFKKANGSAPTGGVLGVVKHLSIVATRNKEQFPILNAIPPADLQFLAARYGAHNGVTNNTGELVYNPSQVYGIDEYHRRTLNLGTMDLSNLTAIVQTNALTESVTCEIFVVYDEIDRAPLGAHRRLGFIEPDVIGGKTGRMQNLFLPEYDFRFGYAALHMKTPAGAAIDTVSSLAASLSGCTTDAPSAIFNPEAVYQIPPEGTWIPDLVDDATRRRTGRIYTPPGTLLIYEPSEVN